MSTISEIASIYYGKRSQEQLSFIKGISQRRNWIQDCTEIDFSDLLPNTYNNEEWLKDAIPLIERACQNDLIPYRLNNPFTNAYTYAEYISFWDVLKAVKGTYPYRENEIALVEINPFQIPVALPICYLKLYKGKKRKSVMRFLNTQVRAYVCLKDIEQIADIGHTKIQLLRILSPFNNARFQREFRSKDKINTVQCHTEYAELVEKLIREDFNKANGSIGQYSLVIPRSAYSSDLTQRAQGVMQEQGYRSLRTDIPIFQANRRETPRAKQQSNLETWISVHWGSNG